MATGPADACAARCATGWQASRSTAGWCHCRTCQLNSGAPAMAFATVPPDDYRRDAGRSSVRLDQDSSSFGQRAFCGECGTPLLHPGRSPARNASISSVATLDDPEAVPPGFHIFWASKRRLVRSGRRSAETRPVPARTPSGWTEPSRPTISRYQAAGRPDELRPPATAGSGCAARRRPSARPARHS